MCRNCLFGQLRSQVTLGTFSATQSGQSSSRVCLSSIVICFSFNHKPCYVYGFTNLISNRLTPVVRVFTSQIVSQYSSEPNRIQVLEDNKVSLYLVNVFLLLSITLLYTDYIVLSVT